MIDRPINAESTRGAAASGGDVGLVARCAANWPPTPLSSSFVVLALMLDNKWPGLVLILALAHRRGVSAAIRRLTVVETPTFKGRFGKCPQGSRQIPGRR
jgi:hypothetical protein